MPDKTELDGWWVAHDIFDLAGRGGFETLQPPYVPGTNDLMDEEPFPEPPIGDDGLDLANVVWDFESETLYAFDPESEDTELTPISPFDLSVYYDPDAEQLLYWDNLIEDFVEIDFASAFGPDQLVFLTPPRAVNPDEESSEVVIERRDALDNPLTVGSVDVFLYSSDPDMVFMFEGNPVDGVTIENGESFFSVTFVTPTPGNPVITASYEELG